jgi:hypothetical protein
MLGSLLKRLGIGQIVPPWESQRTLTESEFWEFIVGHCLRKRVAVQDAESEAARLGTSWQEFKHVISGSDEIWNFRSSEDTWKRLAGRSGYVVLRKGQFIAGIVTELN